MHLRTTGVPGQGVDCPLLRLVINLPRSCPAARRVFAIKLWLRHNVLDNANAWALRTTARPTRKEHETRLVTAGRDTKGQRGFVNPAVFRGSTVLYPTAEDLHAHRAEFSYGRHGSPTTRALQDVLISLEGPQCAGVGLTPLDRPRSPPSCSGC